MEKRIQRLNLPKTIKIALGCCLAYMAARIGGLSYSTSAVTITLLSIQDTRRGTLRLAGTRFLSFFLALGIAALIFSLCGTGLAALGLFLLLFTAGCGLFGLEGGLSMSTVLVLHFWSAGAMTPAAVGNELALMSIGVVMGIVMNLYMPRQAHKIREDQRRIDDGFQEQLLRLADSIPAGGTQESGRKELERRLDAALARAQIYWENSFHADTQYVVQYIQLRRRQWDLLQAMEDCLPRLKAAPKQAYEVASLVRLTAYSLRAYDNAGELLHALEEARRRFRETPLPVTREEFEARAVLYDMVHLLERVMLLKKEFAESLTPSQIRRFWKTDSAAETG